MSVALVHCGLHKLQSDYINRICDSKKCAQY